MQHVNRRRVVVCAVASALTVAASAHASLYQVTMSGFIAEVYEPYTSPSVEDAFVVTYVFDSDAPTGFGSNPFIPGGTNYDAVTEWSAVVAEQEIGANFPNPINRGIITVDNDSGSYSGADVYGVAFPINWNDELGLGVVTMINLDGTAFTSNDVPTTLDLADFKGFGADSNIAIFQIILPASPRGDSLFSYVATGVINSLTIELIPAPSALALAALGGLAAARRRR